MPKKLRAFLDTSAILAGLNSPTGAAGVILAGCFAKQITPVISPQVVEEADRNIPIKFPQLTTAWQSFLLIPPKITKEPTIKQVQAAYNLLPTSDASILAAAITEKPDALITWNTKDFMRKSVVEAVDFPILKPGDFVNQYLKDESA